MANIKSSIKRARQNTVLRQHNTTIRSRVRTFLKKTDALIKEGNKEEAAEAFKQAQTEMDKASQKGIFKKNKGARDISRLHKRLKGIA